MSTTRQQGTAPAWSTSRTPRPTRRRPAASSAAPTRDAALAALQRTAGNAAVVRALALEGQHGQVTHPRAETVQRAGEPGAQQTASSPPEKMSIEEKNAVARIAVGANDQLVLGGSLALVLHGLTARPTDDIDILVRDGKAGRTMEVASALEAKGYTVRQKAGSHALEVMAADRYVELELVTTLPVKSEPEVKNGIKVLSEADCIRMKTDAMGANEKRDKDLIDMHGILEKYGAFGEHDKGNKFFEFFEEKDKSTSNNSMIALTALAARLNKADELPESLFTTYNIGPEKAQGMRDDLKKAAPVVAARLDELLPKAPTASQSSRPKPNQGGRGLRNTVKDFLRKLTGRRT